MDDPSPEPPPLPPEHVPARTGLSTRAIVGIVVGSLLFVFGAVAVVSYLIVTSAVTTMQTQVAQIQCQQNLAQIGALFLVEADEHPGATPRSGQAMLLGWRKGKSLIKGGSEDMLICTADPGVRKLATAEDRRSYDDIDLADPPTDRCSYVVRDFGRFPLVPGSGPVPIAACLHHPEGAFLVHDDGSFALTPWSHLGVVIPPQAVVGPDSPSPLLKELCFRPGVTGR